MKINESFSSSFIFSKTRHKERPFRQIREFQSKFSGFQKPSATPQPPVEFATNTAVSLRIPDQLYGNSFSLVTNISRIIGDVLFVSIERRVIPFRRKESNLLNTYRILEHSRSSSRSSRQSECKNQRKVWICQKVYQHRRRSFVFLIFIFLIRFCILSIIDNAQFFKFT